MADRYICDEVLSAKSLHTNPHVYQKRKLTETALHCLIDYIKQAFGNNHYTLGVFMDKEGAFNNAFYQGRLQHRPGSKFKMVALENGFTGPQTIDRYHFFPFQIYRFRVLNLK